MLLLAARYFVLDLEAEAANPELGFLKKLYLERPNWLYVHIFAMVVPLILGPVQFFLRRLTPPNRQTKNTCLSINGWVVVML